MVWLRMRLKMMFSYYFLCQIQRRVWFVSTVFWPECNISHPATRMQHFIGHNMLVLSLWLLQLVEPVKYSVAFTRFALKIGYLLFSLNRRKTLGLYYQKKKHFVDVHGQCSTFSICSNKRKVEWPDIPTFEESFFSQFHLNECNFCFDFSRKRKQQIFCIKQTSRDNDETRPTGS